MHLPFHPFKDCLLLWSRLRKFMSDWRGGILLGSLYSWTQTGFHFITYYTGMLSSNHERSEVGGRAVRSHHLVRADLQASPRDENAGELRHVGMWDCGWFCKQSTKLCATHEEETTLSQLARRNLFYGEQKFRWRKWAMRVMKDRIQVKWHWAASKSLKEQEGWVCCRFKTCGFDLFRPGKYHL